MHSIQKGIPIPKARRPLTATRRKYPLEEMDVGDMFFVPDKKKNTLATHVSTVGKALGRKFVTRMVFMLDTKQGWKPTEPTTPKAVLGIGVWRTE